MNNTEIVNKLIGSITPAGESHIDEQRFENLKAMCRLTDELVAQIDKVAYENKDRQERSIKEMADYAQNFMTETLGIK